MERLLPDTGGLIEAVALCNPRGLAHRDLVRAHAALLSQLPGEIAVRLLCRRSEADELTHWLEAFGRNDAATVPMDDPLGPDAVWVQDPFVVMSERRRRRYVAIAAEHPCRFAQALAAADGIAVGRSRLVLSGGNLLVGRDFRIVGASSIEGAARGRTPARLARALHRHAALDPRPITLYGHDGSGRDSAVPLMQEPFHVDLAIAPTGCRTMRGEPILLLADPPRWREAYDEAAERLRAAGFHVLRNAVPQAGSSILGYNNVLVENATRRGQRKPLVLVPQFGRNRDDDRALALWSALGFAPRPVGGWTPFAFAGGALRCATKVLKRGPAPAEERVIADHVLSRIGRLAARP